MAAIAPDGREEGEEVVGPDRVRDAYPAGFVDQAVGVQGEDQQVGGDRAERLVEGAHLLQVLAERAVVHPDRGQREAEEADGVQGSGAPHAVGGLGVEPFGVGEPALDEGQGRQHHLGDADRFGQPVGAREVEGLRSRAAHGGRVVGPGGGAGLVEQPGDAIDGQVVLGADRHQFAAEVVAFGQAAVAAGKDLEGRRPQA
ncbi:hypothetical protein ACIBI9_58330 [Nonomuraea sp. NPDC050451]|uniref:hypothetical protein n=1 Tax=Nonomuraea sp. NPDC050451 TaxID=3364364 RepID=UPI0037A5657E